MVPTANASRYLQQLCKHWSHNLEVVFTPGEGKIVFPRMAFGKSYPEDASVTLRAGDTALESVVIASTEEQLEGVKKAVASHLDRFAFREAPLSFDWRWSSISGEYR
ncbi:DUF2218 domain-containing protein [Sphingomonas sp. BN140010]|uniref:DUF2218 domain-containing protein n=2 Tax=Sphingomonas arvum TaxID=2992113 RepID=A0ABT3JBQ0_9SPHN|nr:DUF2218 domain-containing protein [Sphingomonas sp. BN140010]